MKLTTAAAAGLVLLPALALLARSTPTTLPAPPQTQTERSLSVSASGVVTVPASHLSIKAMVQANAELTQQALADLGQTDQRMRSAFAQAELPELELNPQGLKLEYLPEQQSNPNQAVFMSSGQQNVSYGVTSKEPVEIRFRLPADRAEAEAAMTRALDTVIELELELEQPPSSMNSYMIINGRRVDVGSSAVEGVLDDAARREAERAAYEAAYAEAVARAEQVCSAMGVSGVGAPLRVDVREVETTWQGVGAGIDVTTSLAITFELLP